jgi:hypothetical protein
MNKLLMIIIVLLMVIIGFGGYVLYKNNLITLPLTIKNNYVQDLATPTVTPTTTVNSTPTIDESDNLVKIIKLALVAEHGPDANELNVTVSKIDGNYAQGGASATGGGAMWLGAKVGGVWKLVWDGNGVILCKDIAPYDFPVSMVPECWNDSTNKNVKR